MRNVWMIAGAAMTLAACGGNDAPGTDADASDTPAPSASVIEQVAVDQLELHVFDCGTIGISDLDSFSTSGDYAGVADTFTDTCWLVRHPEGDLLWDAGLPGVLVESPPQEQGVFTVSLDASLTQLLRERDIRPADIEYVTISHSHFDHIGQIDQFGASTWLVHADEHAAMFPDDEGEGDDQELSTQFGAFARLEAEIFTGEKDVFGDGSVIIVPGPGHTPGHTYLQVILPETGPVLLTGDMYHRSESRELQRVPRFNADEAQSRASMAEFEARAEQLGARVIIQHEQDDIAGLPDILR